MATVAGCRKLACKKPFNGKYTCVTSLALATEEFCTKEKTYLFFFFICHLVVKYL